MSATPRRRGLTLVAATAGLGLLAGPLALTTGASADDQTSATSASATVQDAREKKAKKKRIKLDLFAINDFHGQLETVAPDTRPGRTSTGEVLKGTIDFPAGGVEYLSTHLKRLRATSADRGAKSFTVAAGDLIGATPLLSAAFHDEPTIEAMNAVGLDASSVGNHEFDEGYRELKRLQKGKCLKDGDGADNQNSCPDPSRPFEGADFKYLAANVKFENTRKPILAPFNVKRVKGKKVAFIGMTLKDTPNIVTKAGVEGLFFKDEVKTVNKLVPRLRDRGVNAMVVLLHQGGVPASISEPSGCDQVTGPGIDIAEALHPEIDVVIQGHTHLPYICTVRDPAGKRRLVTSGYANGRVVTEVRLKLRGKNGEVIRGKSRAINRIVTNSDGTVADAALTALIDRYKTLVAPIANKVIGRLAPAETPNQNLTRTATNPGEESPLGNLIADAQKADASTGSTRPVVAFMNPGGIRADLVENAAGDITYGAAFSVQPFNNYLVSMDLTGAQLRSVLNDQWNGRNETSNVVLQVSGIKYEYSRAAAAGTGDAIVGTPMLDLDRNGSYEAALDPAATYRVVVNSFLADGGDGMPTLAQGANKFFGGLDIDALAAYLGAHNPYTPAVDDRITRVP